MHLLWIKLQNLREAIATYRNSIMRQPDEMKREASLSFFVEYLERYYFLICFAVYLHTERAALHARSPDQSSFADWMKARPELYSIIRRYTSLYLVRNRIWVISILHHYVKLMFLSAYAISIIFDNALLIRVLSVLTAKYDTLASNEVGWLNFMFYFTGLKSPLLLLVINFF